MQAPGGWRPLQPPSRSRRGGPTSLEPSPFVRLARTHVLSVAGDTCVTVALAGSLFFDISPGEAKGKVALSLALTMAPFAVVAPFLGPFMDRWSSGRRRMALGAAAGRAVLAMFAAEAVQSLALFPLVFCMLVLSKAHGVAKASLVKATVDRDDELVRANSRLAVLAAFAGLVAAGPAAIVLKLPFLGPGWVLRLAAVVFGAGAIASVTLVDHRGSGPAADSGVPRARPEGLFAPGIVRAATSMAVLRGTVGFLAFHIAFSFRREGTPNVWLGLVVAASTAGSLLGSAVAPRVRSVLREEHILLGVLLGVATTGVVAWTGPPVAMAAVLALVVAIAAAAGRLAFDSLVQRDNGDAVQGRAFARFEAAFQLVWVVGALVGVLVPFPARSGGLVVAALGAGGAIAYGVELLSRRRAPAQGGERSGGDAQPPAPGPGPPDADAASPAPPPGGVAVPAPGGPAPPTTELAIAPTVEVQLPPVSGDQR